MTEQETKDYLYSLLSEGQKQTFSKCKNVYEGNNVIKSELSNDAIQVTIQFTFGQAPA